MAALVTRSRTALGLILSCVLVVAACIADTPETVVVYTSLDQPFSEPILNDFQAQTGIRVQAVYDVEAAKTTGLTSRLAAERERPRADVFWSSEFAQTLQLKRQGLLDPYDSPAAADIPAVFRDSDYFWTGFAARARVILVNTRLVPPDRYPRSIFDLLDPSWGDGEVGIANPLFGTSATHGAALFAALGADKAQEYYLGLRSRQVRVVDGNSVVRDMVVSGELKVGLTDTDDAQVAVARGDSVAMIFPDQGSDDGTLGTLVIPNTVALVRGAPHPASAKRLIDYLLGPEIEAKLASSGSLQMPVRDAIAVPKGVPRLRDVRGMNVTAEAIADQYPISSGWLRETFLR